ncbi:hypothetical protein Y1Q_0014331 [Alligator mississippiensis]|uniref:Uncharacterized protein n=1 Tax=Alligator mississippiensis TaxID=8496 RepID=A0A151N227_ALLMI|nr:hypothetical protein Y1Q_0014331 [Alligator mississippiensis]
MKGKLPLHATNPGFAFSTPCKCSASPALVDQLSIAQRVTEINPTQKVSCRDESQGRLTFCHASQVPDHAPVFRDRGSMFPIGIRGTINSCPTDVLKQAGEEAVLRLEIQAPGLSLTEGGSWV